MQKPAFVLGVLREKSVDLVGTASAEEILEAIKTRMLAGSEYLSELVRPYVKGILEAIETRTFAGSEYVARAETSFGRARRFV